jgi:uncharacterized protein
VLRDHDHPLPSVTPLHSPQRLADSGPLDPAAVTPLRDVPERNPLLFDFVLKSHLRLVHARLPEAVFEKRRAFMSSRPSAAAVAGAADATLQSPG